MKKMRNFLTLAAAAALTGILLTGCILKQMKLLSPRLRPPHRQNPLLMLKKLLKVTFPAKSLQKLLTALLLQVKRSLL